jgi:hypothetical protein
MCIATPLPRARGVCCAASRTHDQLRNRSGPPSRPAKVTLTKPIGLKHSYTHSQSIFPGEAVTEFLSLDRAVDSVSRATGLAFERRDTERAITFWRKKASNNGPVPALAEFDFSRMQSDWGYRFIISGGDVECSVFLVYGPRFARLVQLPEKPVCYRPMIDQIPERYRPIFVEGSRGAIAEAAPIQFSGLVLHQGQVEFYRAAFMPLRLNAKSAHPLIFGSFNNRVVPLHMFDRDRALIEKYLVN